MSNVTIDTSLNEHLGLPVDYQLDKIEAFKIYQYFMQLFPYEGKIQRPVLEFYIDKNGDFVEDPKNKRDYVVKAIHENMPMSEQFETLRYIEYYKETKGFTSFD